MKEENTYRQTIPSSTTGRYTALTRKAMRICYAAHEGQMDKSGVPYVFHPIHLAEQMETEEEICTALLHDVVEAVRLLTREKDVPYMAYIERLSGNQIARKVKLADLEHNSDLTRLIEVTERDLRRQEKYFLAKEFLLRQEDT